MDKYDIEAIRLLCILGIVLLVGIPLMLVIWDDDIVIGDILKHMSCFELKKITNSTQLKESNYAKAEYGERC